MDVYDILIRPFVEYAFLRRALVACFALSLGGAPLGIFLILRRMTLVGDALSHAILPGIAIAFFLCGLSLWPMTLGGLAAGLAVAFLARAVSRATPLKEDASFTGVYLLSLSAGVLLIGLRGSSVDLIHVLFGNVLAIDPPALWLMTASAALTALVLAGLYRGMVIECLDPGFLHVSGRGEWRQGVFLALLVIGLVSAYQTLGTLMALGLLVLPGMTARLWSRRIDTMLPLAIALAMAASVLGLLVSYHRGVPSGPSIVLSAGGFYVLTLLAQATRRRPGMQPA